MNDRVLDILDRLIAFNTVSANSNLDMIAYIEAYLTQRGFRTVRIDDPNEPKAGLYAEIGPGGPGIVLSAHTDVVPVDGQPWSRDPFKLNVEGERLFGRGTTDMKGFVAAMLSVADAASHMRLREPLRLVFSYDEEIGCVGISRMMERLAPLLGASRLALVGEPTEMRVAVGHKGKRSFRADLRGEAGHSAMAPHFINALHVSADFIQALRAIQSDLADMGARDTDYDIAYSTVHVGTLAGGHALNIVPDCATMSFEVRHLPEDDPDALEDRIRLQAQRIASAYGDPSLIHIECVARYPGLETPVDAPAVEAVMRAGAAGGDATKVAFGTEAGFFSGCGIPTVVCGPGSMAGQGHKANEFLDMTQLQQCERLLARLMEEIG